MITIFATGAGLWAGTLGSGDIASATLISPQLPVSVLISSPGLPQSTANQHAAMVLYAGSAPTLTDGVLQVNMVLPVAADLANGPEVRLVLQVGGSQAPAVTVAVPH